MSWLPRSHVRCFATVCNSSSLDPTPSCGFHKYLHTHGIDLHIYKVKIKVNLKKRGATNGFLSGSCQRTKAPTGSNFSSARETFPGKIWAEGIRVKGMWVSKAKSRSLFCVLLFFFFLRQQGQCQLRRKDLSGSVMQKQKRQRRKMLAGHGNRGVRNN